MLPFESLGAVFTFALVVTIGIADATGRGGAGIHRGRFLRRGKHLIFHRRSINRQAARHGSYRRLRYGDSCGGVYLGIPAYNGYEILRLYQSGRRLALQYYRLFLWAVMGLKNGNGTRGKWGSAKDYGYPLLKACHESIGQRVALLSVDLLEKRQILGGLVGRKEAAESSTDIG